MNLEGTQIALLGCGWLGMPLAKKLIRHGALVKGSVTSESGLEVLKQEGIEPHLIEVTPDFDHRQHERFFLSEILIIDFPPARRKDIVLYLTFQMRGLIEAIKYNKIKKILFVSSTSVYPANNLVVKEADARNPEKESGKALLEGERLIMSNKGSDTTIIRFGGLIGYDRNPARFLSGSKAVKKNGHVPVNLIHQDDCINIIMEIIRKDKWNQIYNACAPEHPLRYVFYSLAARKCGYQEPVFDENAIESYKIIDSSKLISDLKYIFKYPNPLSIFD